MHNGLLGMHARAHTCASIMRLVFRIYATSRQTRRETAHCMTQFHNQAKFANILIAYNGTWQNIFQFTPHLSRAVHVYDYFSDQDPQLTAKGNIKAVLVWTGLQIRLHLSHWITHTSSHACKPACKHSAVPPRAHGNLRSATSGSEIIGTKCIILCQWAGCFIISRYWALLFSERNHL